MATKYFCDECGSEIKYGSTLAKLINFDRYPEEPVLHQQAILCADCAGPLWEYIGAYGECRGAVPEDL